MLTEMVEYSLKIEKKNEGYAKWNEEKYIGSQQWWEGNWDSNNGVDQKEESNIQPEKNEETRTRKNEERLRNLQDILKCSNIRIIWVPEE